MELSETILDVPPSQLSLQTIKFGGRYQALWFHAKIVRIEDDNVIGTLGKILFNYTAGTWSSWPPKSEETTMDFGGYVISVTGKKEGGEGSVDGQRAFEFTNSGLREKYTIFPTWHGGAQLEVGGPPRDGSRFQVGAKNIKTCITVNSNQKIEFRSLAIVSTTLNPEWFRSCLGFLKTGKFDKVDFAKYVPITLAEPDEDAA